MEFGIFNSLYIPQRLVDENGAAAEHKPAHGRGRLVERRRPGRLQVHVGDRAPLPHRVLAPLGERGVPRLPRGGAPTRIHLGSGIFNVTPPVNHPARVAERVAMLDHLSEGRFEFGMGRGSSTTEQKGFGIDDPELTRDMFDEVVARVRARCGATRSTRASTGEFFSMPARNVLPKPYSEPHPPMWVAAGNPSTFEKAGAHGPRRAVLHDRRRRRRSSR